MQPLLEEEDRQGYPLAMLQAPVVYDQYRVVHEHKQVREDERL
jgi:hypothetical protein